MGARISRGARNIRWVERYCRIPEGRDVGQPVRLRPWQKRIIRGIYDTPTRRAIISFGRKNAKTTLAGFLCLLHLAGPEAQRNSQLYSAAQSRDQAGVLFALMAKIVRMSPDLDACIHIRESTKTLICEDIGTVYRALSAEASTAYGLSTAFVVHDELGQVVGPRSELYDALETAAGAQDQPLSVIISTQAPTDADLLSVLIDDAKAGHDPRVKLFLYTADESLDPFSVKAIRSANPAFGDFLNRAEVLSQAGAAKRMPSSESSYRNLVLNQRVARTARFVSPAVWKRCGLPPRPEDFERGVTAALDLSELVDLTALVYLGRGDDGVWSVGCQFFAPEEGLIERAKRDRVPYDVWARMGLLTLTPGNSVDYAVVAKHLGEFCSGRQVDHITFDRWAMRIFRSELSHLGLDDLPLDEKGHGQGMQDMTPALLALETELLNGNMRHGNNPMLTWCASNAVVVRDAAGGRKLDKSKSTGRIDGMVALAMAINRASAAMTVGKSFWETEVA